MILSLAGKVGTEFFREIIRYLMRSALPTVRQKQKCQYVNVCEHVVKILSCHPRVKEIA